MKDNTREKSNNIERNMTFNRIKNKKKGKNQERNGMNKIGRTKRKKKTQNLKLTTSMRIRLNKSTKKKTIRENVGN